MDRKVALVTGANSGMGKATAMALVREGMHVVMLCRSETRGMEAMADVCAQSGDSVSLMLCDLGDMTDVVRFTAAFKERYHRLDVLVNNAGVITVGRYETKDGLEQQFGVNHIGHFLLTTCLLDTIKSTGDARIVVVGSGAHKVGSIDFDNIPLIKGYSVATAYSRSKLCNMLFVKELSRRLEGSGVVVNCVHPGAVGTNIAINRETGFGKTITRLLKWIVQTPEQGAATAIYLASSPDASGVSGEYFYRCEVHKPSRKACDEVLAKRLWELSESITAPFLADIGVAASAKNKGE